MLTCKSLFGLGYRGERLIEPFYRETLLWWLRVPPEREALVGLGRHRRQAQLIGETVKLRGHVARLSVGPIEGNFGWHPG